MKLLILTQRVDENDAILGFFHSWLLKFAHHCEKIIVICLEKGNYNLPKNVKVLSLGKEKIANARGLKRKFTKIKYIFNFYRFIWRERNNYDNVFVHMNPEYVVLGGLLWKMWNKKIGLWYTHKAVNLKLRLAEKLSDIIFTASKESFRLKSKKLRIVGHGIDVNKFKAQSLRFKTNRKFRIITVGRISPVKDYETIIKAMEVLNNQGLKFGLDIIGGAGLPEQEKYFKKLKKQVKAKKLEQVIKFFGPIPNKDIDKYYQKADLFVNASHTGSLDKAILEAMASGLPILTCNGAMLEVLDDYGESLMFKKNNYKELAERIKLYLNLDFKSKEKIAKDMRKIVAENHSLERLVKKIKESF